MTEWLYRVLGLVNSFFKVRQQLSAPDDKSDAANRKLAPNSLQPLNPKP